MDVPLAMTLSMNVCGPMRCSPERNHHTGALINQVGKMAMELLLVGLSSQPAPCLLKVAMASATGEGAVKVCPPDVVLYRWQ